jgi:Raf kinase inhibitor-like YbhB/YbcL family protein
MRRRFQAFKPRDKSKSPALKWSGAPEGTRSFAVTMYDPDAPTGSGWWHWMVINIPADTTELASGAGEVNSTILPKGALQNRIDYGVAAWGGTCPPQGDKPHRYIFTVYALKTDKLDVPADATAALTGYMIHGMRWAKPASPRNTVAPSNLRVLQKPVFCSTGLSLSNSCLLSARASIGI